MTPIWKLFCMATPIIRSSDSSAYALVLAYALIVLSLWKVDMGLVGRPGFTAWGGDNTVARRFASAQTADEFRSEVYRLLASTLERSDTISAGVGVGTEPQNQERRRLAALALMVSVSGDGIRR
jgi:hypothetical protein